MSAVEAISTLPAPVEEVKPTEVVPVTESSAPAKEAPKAEDAAAPVRLFFERHMLLFPNFIQGGCKSRSGSGWLTTLPVISLLIHIFGASKEGAEPAAAAEPASEAAAATEDAKPVRTCHFQMVSLCFFTYSIGSG